MYEYPDGRVVDRDRALYGIYYGRALVRGEGIRETKEKISKLSTDNDLLTNLLLTVT